MWIYIRNTDSHGCITVGFYNPDGEFQVDSDHTSIESAAERVHYLNGGHSKKEIKELLGEIAREILKVT